MRYSYQDLQNKLKKINEDQLKTIKDNIEKIIDSVEKGGEIEENRRKLIDFDNQRKRIEAEINALT